MGSAEQAKLSPQLVEQLAAADDASPVEVVVELQPVGPPSTGSRRERIAAAKEAFEHEAREVKTSIADAGGQVLESAWINQTLKTRLPARAVKQLAENELVSAIDLPRPVEPDTHSA